MPKPCRSRRSKSLLMAPWYPAHLRPATKVGRSTRPLRRSSMKWKASMDRLLNFSCRRSLKPANITAEELSSSKRLTVPVWSLSMYCHKAMMLPRKPISTHLRANCCSPNLMFASGSSMNQVRTGLPKRRLVKLRNSRSAWNPNWSFDFPATPESNCTSWFDGVDDRGPAVARLEASAARVATIPSKRLARSAASGAAALSWANSTLSSSRTHVAGRF
mmetsp:Transcript_54229/g.116418  ORF Transcript_54229/g.116418 Transcript_54229/m.116418 type:complete len:218 (+) Transcript_54229:725-1378(+)